MIRSASSSLYESASSYAFNPLRSTQLDDRLHDDFVGHVLQISNVRIWEKMLTLLSSL